MHGREGEDRRRKTYMQPAPHLSAATAVANPPLANSCHSHETCFSKDGRKISIGDCALFQAEGSPPFIGLIHCLTLNKENHHKIGVNWLYRPADVKLDKNISFDVAPNEVFYSFHRDEISADFLLHPCKVAFLPKGVELPPGVSSFVCRRVYDTENKCLWWLTDKDYVNEWKEQVDKLLDKTWIEMYAEGRSPKTLNSPSSQQLKSLSGSVPSTATSFPSQIKGKKRERGDQGLEPIKRDRSSKTDDVDSGHAKSDNVVKLEVAKMTDKDGGLVNMEGVEKLVQLMQPDRPEKKIDLAGRIVLADVIATTDKVDCLSRFVQLRGLTVLDDWLQEAHKGKVGDSTSQKEGDKSVEDLLLALLRALDKLPVNLHALQSCNIGKSVNHLRNHKNLDIHKKAKGLVDTWKKRVDAEMKIYDAKSGSSQAASWPGKSSFSESSHGGSKRTGSSDILISSVSQPSASKTPNKFGHGESAVKSASASPSSIKLSHPTSATSVSKDSCIKAVVPSGTSDVPLTTTKEGKGSSSTQSLNNSQSCSSDLAKVAGSVWKEDSRSTIAVSVNAKTSGGSSHHRRSSNGFVTSGAFPVQKESASGKLGLVDRNITSEKASQSGVSSERTTDPVPGDHLNTQRLIVKLPNPTRSPAHSLNGGSFDDAPAIGSRASSPGTSDKHDQGEQKLKGKTDVARGNLATDVNNESWQSNDVKDGLSGSDEGERSPALAFDEEENKNHRKIGKTLGISKATSLSSAKQMMVSEQKYVKFYDTSCSSMNALVESCAQYSEIPAALSSGDDLGMNLLASVAAGEMSKSDLVSPNTSPVRSSCLHEDSNNGKDSKSQSLHENIETRDPGQQDESEDDESEKQGNDAASSKFREDGEVTNATSHGLGDGKTSSDKNEKSLGSCEMRESENLCAKPETKTTTDWFSAELNGMRIGKAYLSRASEFPVTEEHKQGSEKRNASSSEYAPDVSMDVKKRSRSPSTSEMATIDAMLGKLINSSIPTSDILHRTLCDVITEISHQTICCPPQSQSVDASSNHTMEKETMKVSILGIPAEMDAVSKKASKVEGFAGDFSNECRRQSVVTASSLDANDAGDNSQVLPGSSNTACADEQLRPETVKEMNCDANLTQVCDQVKSVEVGTDAGVGEPALASENDVKEDKSDNKVITDQHLDASPSSERSAEQIIAKSVVADVPPEPSSAASGLQPVAVIDSASKIEFDLNEGFPADDGNQDEQASFHQSTTVPFSVSPISSGPSTSITIAAAAKGSFIPPENMMNNKADTRWKGSAATSAFRRAEPRKILEAPISTSEFLLSSDTCTSKQSRPVLDIDLNEPDERVSDVVMQCSFVEDPLSDLGLKPPTIEMFSSMSSRSAGLLDLDLNRSEEGLENVQTVGTSTQRLEIPLFSRGALSSFGGLSNGDHAHRDFDLNDGPGIDEGVADPAPPCYSHSKSSGGYLPPVANLRMNDLGNISSWLPPAGSYPQVPISPFVSDRVEQPYSIVATAGGVQRILGSSIGGPAAFGADMYRAPIQSSSPTMSFAAPTAFPYPSFPFGGGFPLASTSFPAGSTYVESSSGSGSYFPAVPPQLVGATTTVSAPYGRPYMISHPDSPGCDISHKWARPGLDLNAGPGNNDADTKGDRFTAIRQLSASNPQALAEEHVRLYQAAGGSALKRKEPEGGWDADRLFGYKQPSWP